MMWAGSFAYGVFEGLSLHFSADFERNPLVVASLPLFCGFAFFILQINNKACLANALTGYRGWLLSKYP
jgi:hypothetical protein